MSWQDDPEIQLQLAERSARAKIMRSAVIWTPLFVASLAGFLFFFVDRAFLGHDYGGTWFLVGLLGVLSFLFGFQAMQALLDLTAEPAELEGEVTRAWSRTDSLVVRSHYMRIGSKIFTVNALLHDAVKEGDLVSVRYYPHSAVVIAVEKHKPTATDEQRATTNE